MVENASSKTALLVQEVVLPHDIPAHIWLDTWLNASTVGEILVDQVPPRDGGLELRMLVIECVLGRRQRVPRDRGPLRGEDLRERLDREARSTGLGQWVPLLASTSPLAVSSGTDWGRSDGRHVDGEPQRWTPQWMATRRERSPETTRSQRGRMRRRGLPYHARRSRDHPSTSHPPARSPSGNQTQPACETLT